MKKTRCAIVCMAVFACGSSWAGDESKALCAQAEQQIETALKDLAGLTQDLLVEEVDSVARGLTRPGVTKPAFIANNWGQIQASLLHMSALGCKPFGRAIDPRVYEAARAACKRDRNSCDRSKWVRSDS